MCVQSYDQQRGGPRVNLRGSCKLSRRRFIPPRRINFAVGLRGYLRDFSLSSGKTPIGLIGNVDAAILIAASRIPVNTRSTEQPPLRNKSPRISSRSSRNAARVLLAMLHRHIFRSAAWELRDRSLSRVRASFPVLSQASEASGIPRFHSSRARVSRSSSRNPLDMPIAPHGTRTGVL